MLNCHKKKVVWLASYPRSGSTHFRMLLKRIYGAEHASIYEGEEIPSIRIDEIDRYDQTDNQSYRNLDEFCFAKTHELPDDSLPAVYLVRDGRDALISYAWYILNVERVESDFYRVLKELILNPDFFGGWANHVLSWRSRPAMTSIVRFEDIICCPNPRPVIENTLKQLNFKIPVGLKSKPIPSFEALHQKFPDYFRKGKIGAWKYEMPADLHDLFWDVHGEGMAAAGYAYND